MNPKHDSGKSKISSTLKGNEKGKENNKIINFLIFLGVLLVTTGTAYGLWVIANG